MSKRLNGRETKLLTWLLNNDWIAAAVVVTVVMLMVLWGI